MANRPDLSGRSTSTCQSNRPARSKAGSKISGRFVAANRTMPALGSKPSSSANSWLSVCSFSSWLPRTLATLLRPSASSSSMKMMQGAAFLACSNKSLTRAAPTPTNSSTNSDPEIEKNAAPASPATAREQRLAGAGRSNEQKSPLGRARPGGRSSWDPFVLDQTRLPFEIAIDPDQCRRQREPRRSSALDLHQVSRVREGYEQNRSYVCLPSWRRVGLRPFALPTPS